MRACLRVAGVAGEAALRFEKMPVADAVDRVLRVLRSIHEPRGIQVPEPLQVRASPASHTGSSIGSIICTQARAGWPPHRARLLLASSCARF